MSRHMIGKLSAFTHTKIAIALFSLLLFVGSGVFLAACSPSNGLQGTVASVDLATSSFVLTPPQNSAGITSLTVSVSPQTSFHGVLHHLSDLTIGMPVRVQGTANTTSQVLVASEVEDANEQNDQGNDHSGAAAGDGHDAAELKGTVAAIDSTNSSFTLQFSDGTSKSVTVSAQTQFEGSLHAFIDIVKGQRVEVKGAPQTDGTFAASSVQGEDENNDKNDANGIELTGTVTSLDTAHSSFVLTQADKTTKTIATNGQTEFDGGISGFTGLKVGSAVEVRGAAQTDGSVLASRVHREDDGSSDNSGSSDGHDGSGSGNGSGSGSGSGDGSGDGHGGSGSGSGGDGNGSGDGGSNG